MTVLTLIRHAPTKWNEEGRLQGRTDVPLSERGRILLADWRVPPDLAEASWVSSPLSRALETARALGAEPAIEKRLIEIDRGAWEGKTLAEIGRSLGRDVAEMEARGLDFQAPDGEPRRGEGAHPILACRDRDPRASGRGGDPQGRHSGRDGLGDRGGDRGQHDGRGTGQTRPEHLP